MSGQRIPKELCTLKLPSSLYGATFKEHSMNETKIYLDKAQAKVTNELLIINSWRFYIRNINTVFVTRQATYRRYPIGIAILFIFIAMVTNSYVMMFLSLPFILMAYLMKTYYHLRIKSYTGEIHPLTSTNKQELEEIKRAVEAALMDNLASDQQI